jgi:hypothetical protein
MTTLAFTNPEMSRIVTIFAVCRKILSSWRCTGGIAMHSASDSGDPMSPTQSIGTRSVAIRILALSGLGAKIAITSIFRPFLAKGGTFAPLATKIAW